MNEGIFLNYIRDFGRSGSVAGRREQSLGLDTPSELGKQPAPCFGRQRTPHYASFILAEFRKFAQSLSDASCTRVEGCCSGFYRRSLMWASMPGPTTADQKDEDGFRLLSLLFSNWVCVWLFALLLPPLGPAGFEVLCRLGRIPACLVRVARVDTLKHNPHRCNGRERERETETLAALALPKTCLNPEEPTFFRTYIRKS